MITGVMNSEASFRDSVYLKAMGGLSLLGDTDINQAGAATEGEFSLGQLSGAGIGYKINESWALELEYLYRSNELDTASGGAFGAATGGDFTTTSIMFNAVYTAQPFDLLSTGKQLSPYYGFGVGFLTEGDIDLEIGGVKQEYSEKFMLAGQVFAGLSYEMNANWSLFGELRYSFAGEIEMEPSGGGSEVTADYNGFQVMIGLRYDF